MTIHNEKQVKKQIQELTVMLGGKYNYQIAIDTTGKGVKRIIIEYDNEISEDSA